MKKKVMTIILIIIGILVVIGAIDFARTEKAGWERFATYEAKAQTINTSFGEMSFIDEGTGEPIMSVHGICGGYDQAYDTLGDKTDTYRVLAPSRFGYPGTDMPENATIDMQTDAYAEMLDQLGIEKTYVLATSAGGTSAIKFAMNHPDRVKGLILYCSGYPGLEAPEKELTVAGPPAALCNDFAMWLISPLFKPLMGMDRSTLSMIMPFKDKKDGIVFDGKVTNTVMVNDYEEYDMSSLEVPVLMIHAKDDKLANYEGVAPWAEKIPDCIFVALEGGGHLMVGNEEIISKSLADFVEKTK